MTAAVIETEARMILKTTVKSEFSHTSDRRACSVKVVGTNSLVFSGFGAKQVQD